MGARIDRMQRALHVGRVVRRSGLLRVLGEIGVVGDRPETREGARRFRLALEELGTTYIKLGQLLSSRPDLLPDVYIEELDRLVDQVPPAPFTQIEQTIGEELPDDVFTSVDPEPIATASIAQIHPALLKSGREVVVKVRRPGIEQQIELDLDVLRSTASLIEGRSRIAQIVRITALADELETHLRAELDFTEEAHNAELIAEHLVEFEDLVVAKPVRPWVTERVLVLERIDGEKVADATASRRRGAASWRGPSSAPTCTR
jgi:ubiquinone biosynthesis protein